MDRTPPWTKITYQAPSHFTCNITGDLHWGFSTFIAVKWSSVIRPWPGCWTLTPGRYHRHLRLPYIFSLFCFCFLILCLASMCCTIKSPIKNPTWAFAKQLAVRAIHAVLLTGSTAFGEWQSLKVMNSPVTSGVNDLQQSNSDPLISFTDTRSIHD